MTFQPLFSISAAAAIVLGFSAPQSHASDDLMGPIVQTMRYHFERAKTPTLSDLQVGRTWSCMEYYAHAHDFASTGIKYDDEFRFVVKRDASIFNEGSGSGNGYVWNKAGFQAGHGRNEIRVTPDGDLIAEGIFGLMGTSDEYPFAAIQDGEQCAMYYTYCSNH